MDWGIVDVQGFKDINNRFIVKEFYLETRNMTFHDIVKSPVELKRILNRRQRNSIDWLTHQYHGIHWNDGFIELSELRNILWNYLDKLRLFVKGKEKILWLKQIMKNDNLSCVNFEEFDNNISLRNAEKKKDFICCINHAHIKSKKIAQCAVANVKILRKWTREIGFIEY